jgi:hypothetical protein
MSDDILNEMGNRASITALTPKKHAVRQSMISQWGIICVVIAIVATQFRPQLAQLMKELGPLLLWLRQKLSGEKGAAVVDTSTNVKEQQAVVAKLTAMGAKVYGSMHCSWTRRQLEIIGVDITSELFVDCDKDPTQCANIQAFPTWSIQGKTEPGYLPLDALGMIADGVLLKAFKSAEVDRELQGVESSADVVEIAPEVVEMAVVAPEPIAAEPIAAEPIAAEPIAADPIATEPAVTEPVSPRSVAEPVATEPVATEPVATEPAPEPVDPVALDEAATTTAKKRGRGGRAVVLVDRGA